MPPRSRAGRSTVIVTASLPPEMVAAVDRYSDSQGGIGRSAVIRRALNVFEPLDGMWVKSDED